MNNIASEFFSLESIDGREEISQKFHSRYEALLTDMNDYIAGSGYGDKLYVNPSLLASAVVDYFADIKRLKALHNVEHVNSIKVVSYTSYWLLKRKPIQLRDVDEKLIYANERFVFSYIMDFLNKDEQKQEDDNIYLCRKKGMDTFKEMLFYFLKYRCSEPLSIEMAITSFFAGQIYQEDREDLSGKLSSKYKYTAVNTQKIPSPCFRRGINL